MLLSGRCCLMRRRLLLPPNFDAGRVYEHARANGIHREVRHEPLVHRGLGTRGAQQLKTPTPNCRTCALGQGRPRSARLPGRRWPPQEESRRGWRTA